MAVRPFKVPINPEIDTFGGTITSRCLKIYGYNVQPLALTYQSIFYTCISEPIQYGIGNAILFVIVLENGSCVTPFLLLWGQLRLGVTLGRSDGKVTEL